MLGIGVEFGTVGADGEGEAVKWAGCGKMVGGITKNKITIEKNVDTGLLTCMGTKKLRTFADEKH